MREIGRDREGEGGWRGRRERGPVGREEEWDRKTNEEEVKGRKGEKDRRIDE